MKNPNRVAIWYKEKDDAQRLFDLKIISRKDYDYRTKLALGRIYRGGNSDDKRAAINMAKAHGYKLKEILDVSQ